MGSYEYVGRASGVWVHPSCPHEREKESEREREREREREPETLNLERSDAWSSCVCGVRMLLGILLFFLFWGEGVGTFRLQRSGCLGLWGVLNNSTIALE